MGKMLNIVMEQVTDSRLWHEVMAEVIRQYAGKMLPSEVVIQMPEQPSGDTLVVHRNERQLRISLVSSAEAESYRQMGLSGWLR